MSEIVAYFSVEEAAKLTGLHANTLRRWDKRGIYRPAHALENRRRPLSRLYNFTDIVALRAMARAKAQGVLPAELHKVAVFIAQHPETSWKDTSFYIVGRQLYFTYPEAELQEKVLLATNPLGQRVLPGIVAIDLESIADDARERVVALGSRSEAQIGKTERSRFIVSGAEVFAGTRIPIETIVGLIEGGWPDEEILTNYPRLALGDLAAAKERTERLLLSSAS